MVSLFADNDDWEEVCYQNSHRDFFRVLKHHHIDLLATYESMHCSEDFLYRLYSRRVLSTVEYEDLLASSRALTRPNMNKKMLDLVNSKKKQLQEIFCDVLCFYQSHLIVLDEEDRTTQQSMFLSFPE